MISFNAYITNSDPLIVHASVSVLRSDLRASIIAAIARDSGSISKSSFQKIVEFRRSLGTRDRTSRQQRIDDIAFGHE